MMYESHACLPPSARIWSVHLLIVVGVLGLTVGVCSESYANREVEFVVPKNAAGNTSDRDFLITADAGLQAWLESLNFVGTYKYYRRTANNFSDALSSSPDGTLEATGSIAKGMGMLRNSMRPAAQMVASEMGPAGTVEVQNARYEEVSSEEIALSYLPQLLPSKNYGEALFKGRDDLIGKVGKYESGVRSAGRISPLSLTGDSPGSALRTPLGAENIVVQVEETPKTRHGRKVSIKYRFRGCDYVKQVELDLASRYPIIKSIDISLDFGSKAKGRIRAEASNFVDCDGVRMASTVRRALSHGNDSLVLLTEWRSVDLGERSPVKDDFLITIHKDTAIKGLQLPEKSLRDGKLDVSLVSSADIIVPGIPAGQQPATLSSSGETSRLWLIANVLVVLVIAALVLYRWKHTHSKQASANGDRFT